MRLAIRPQHIRLSAANSSATLTQTNANVLDALVREINFTGATTSVKLDANGLLLEVLLLQLKDNLVVGDACAVELPPQHIAVLTE